MAGAKRRRNRRKTSGGPNGNQPQVNQEQESDRIRYICADASRQGFPHVGPRYQADIPSQCTNLAAYLTDADTTKWLGTNIWLPVDDEQRVLECPGPHYIPCVNCIEHRVKDATERKRDELGPGFENWRFEG